MAAKVENAPSSPEPSSRTKKKDLNTPTKENDASTAPLTPSSPPPRPPPIPTSSGGGGGGGGGKVNVQIGGLAGEVLADQEDDRAGAIKVAVRCRPFLPFEAGNKSVVTTIPETKQIKIVPSGSSSLDPARNTFTFDAVYGIESTQAQVFTNSIAPLVQACLEGYNATVLAYGQTGSGKTHSILGQTNGGSADEDPATDSSEAGVIPRALRSIFWALRTAKESSTKEHSFDYDVKVQFLEIYGDDIRDLLQTNPNDAPKLSIRDGKKNVEPEVIGIKVQDVQNADDALLCLTRGTLRRVTRATSMNSESSRSHAIMTVLIEQKFESVIESTKEKSVKQSKFHFVDLAGSERIKRTNATGQGIKEGIDINKGLLILGNVISALASQAMGKSKDNFVPYRDSKLTRLLKGSLGGNHKTLMIACVSPSGSNTDESLNSLRYANRAKNIQNKAVVNMDAGSKLIAELRLQLKAMAKELLRVRGMVADGVVLDGENQIFTEDVLQALVAGGEVNLKVENANKKPKKKTSAAGAPAGAAPAGGTSTPVPGTSSPVSTRPSSAATATTAQSTVPNGTSQASSGGRTTTANGSVANQPQSSSAASTAETAELNEKLKKSKDEIKKLRRALEKSDDRVIESERQLQWVKEELRVSKEEVMALSGENKSGGDEGSQASNVSALTDEYDGDSPRLSQETYETVKTIYEEKLIQMSLELKEREDERENIAMTLYRHESDSQRLFYVKNTLTEDLSRKEEQIAELKNELRDMANLQIVPDGQAQTGQKFRRLRRGGSRRAAASTSMSMSAYYTEKLNKIERHIKLREEECANLGTELEKLETDSQIFTDLAKDLSERLKAKDEQMSSKKDESELGAMTQQQLSRLNVVIEKDREEREQLVAELKRLKDDSETFTALVKALTEERSTKMDHVEKYKRRHRELATSIGLTSPYVDSGNGTDSGDFDDDASVSSAWSLMSIDSVNTSNTNFSASLNTISKLDYDQKVSQLEAGITKHEEDRIFILNDLEKLEADTHAFSELSNSLKQKLQMKEEQIDLLRKDLDDFANRLKKQEKELADLTTENKEVAVAVQ